MPSRPVLLADVGGTHVRFALRAADGRVTRHTVLDCADYPSLAAACGEYLGEAASDIAPAEAGIAVACPVLGDRIELTNRDWRFSREALRRQLGLERLEVLNDFAALALALPSLAPGDTRSIKPGEPVAGAPIGLLGPGTGLGVAALILHGAEAIPIATEGGHRDLAATSEREWQVHRWLAGRFGHVSTERVLSGPGLANLHDAICALDGVVGGERRSPAAVVEGARAGVPACREAVHLFSSWLGAVAGDLALILGARGGIYLCGGVVPRMGSAFELEAFRSRFVAKGRFADYLSPVPVSLVLRTESALAGIAVWMSRPPESRRLG